MTARPSRGRPPSAARPLLLAGVVVAVVVAAIGAATLLGQPRRQVATGVVVAVRATSLSNVEGFTIRTQDGATVDFRVGRLENGAVFPASHLAEHKVSLEPIRVTFVDEGGGHVAVRLEDAP